MVATRSVEHKVAVVAVMLNIATCWDCVLRPPAVYSNDRNYVDGDVVV